MATEVTYNKTVWEDFPSLQTPISAAALNNIEEAIENIATVLTATNATVESNNTTLTSKVSAAQTTANQGVDDAATANSNANSAKATAATAESTASAAASTASSAMSTAQTAQITANKALPIADFVTYLQNALKVELASHDAISAGASTSLVGADGEFYVIVCFSWTTGNSLGIYGYFPTAGRKITTVAQGDFQYLYTLDDGSLMLRNDAAEGTGIGIYYWVYHFIR